MAIWALCRVVQMAVHFFVNFNVFKSLYLAYYWALGLFTPNLGIL